MSGRLIGGVVGAVIGGYFGNAQLGWMIGSAVGGYVDPDVVQGPRLTDASQQYAQDGVPLVWGFGTFPTAGNNIIFRSELWEVKHKKRQGKGGPVQETFTYHRSYAIGVCEGPIDGFLQIKRNGKIVFDARPDDELLALGYTASTIKEIRATTAKFMDKVTLYLGDETQMPDPTIESFEGAGNVAPFRGLAYIVVEADDLTESAGAVAQYEFVVVYNGEPGTAEGQYKALQYAGDVFPWLLNSDGLVDPRRVGTQYEYAVIDTDHDFTSTDLVWRSSLADTFGDVPGYRPITGTPVLRGWSANILVLGPNGWGAGGTIVPWKWSGSTPDANDYAGVGLIFSRFPATSEAAVDYYSTAPAYGEGHWVATLMNEPGGSVYGSGVLCATGTGNDENRGENKWWSDIVIACRPKVICNSDIPLYWIPVPDAPGTFVDPEGQLHFQEICEEAVGTFKQLAIFDSSFGGVGNATLLDSIPQGPLLALGDIDYDNETFWTDAYDEAVSAGTMPAGLIYGAHYPIPVTDGCLCIPNTPTIARDRIILAEVVAAICQRSGMSADDYDVSQLTDILDGYRIASEGNGEAFISPLMQAYLWDATEYDGKLRCIKRGGSPGITITEDELAERDGDAVEWERVQEPELLRKQTVAYLSPRAGFTRMTQQAERRSATVQAIGEATVELPVVMSDDDAAQVAEKRIKVAWTEPEKCKFSLPYKFSELTPCDVIWLPDQLGQYRNVRVMSVQEDSGVLLCEGSLNRQSAYVSVAKGTVANPPLIVTPGVIGPTNAIIMNLPVLRETDDEAGLYIAIAGYLSGWSGAEVQFSSDGGATYSTAAEISEAAVIGYTLTPLLAEVSSEYLSQQSVTVYLPEAPESVSYEAMLRYANRAIINGEVLQYQTVTPVDATTFTLSGLVRGRYNTDPVEHASGSPFVLFDEAVQFVPTPTWMIGQSLKHKAVSYGTSPDSYTGIDYTYSPCVSQTEFPPTYVRAVRDGSDNVTVTWIGRGRIGAEVAPRNSKYFTGYRVTWTDGVTTTTADTTSTTYTIPSAADPITVMVSALNTITGAGPVSEEVVA